MTNFIKIDSADIKEGMRFSAPVFFDDGKNMFLAEGRAVKPLHIAALKRWAIPFLLTYGHELKDNPVCDRIVPPAGDDELLEDLEAVEEAEPVDDPVNT